MKIGVLALQGAFRGASADARRDRRRGRSRCACRPISTSVAGLILPGGESTTMRKLIDRWGLRAADPRPGRERRAAVRHLRRDDRPGPRDRRRRGADPAAPRRHRPAQRVRPPARLVRGRSAPSRSWATSRSTACSSGRRSSTGPGPDVDVLARLDDGRIVAVRERNIIATAFHPELAGETRFHRLVATMAAEHDDPGEGSGRRRHPTRRSRTA